MDKASFGWGRRGFAHAGPGSTLLFIAPMPPVNGTTAPETVLMPRSDCVRRARQGGQMMIGSCEWGTVNPESRLQIGAPHWGY
jgi:hypothetical protein